MWGRKIEAGTSLRMIWRSMYEDSHDAERR